MDLPEKKLRTVEIALDDDALAELRARGEEDELAPVEEEPLVRYLIYLGAGYFEAERTAAAVESPEAAYAALHRLRGAAAGQAAVLLFHHAEAARGFAEERRAQAAHERMAGGYEFLVERMRAEIETRERRVRNLERALER